MEKIRKILNKHKIETVVVSLVVIVGMIFLIGRSLADTESTYLRNQEIDGILFEDANLVYENNESTYTVKVYNDTDSSYNLKTIPIKFTNESGVETTLVGYIGDSLLSHEGRLVTASIDKDLSDSIKVEYVINK